MSGVWFIYTLICLNPSGIEMNQKCLEAQKKNQEVHQDCVSGAGVEEDESIQRKESTCTIRTYTKPQEKHDVKIWKIFVTRGYQKSIGARSHKATRSVHKQTEQIVQLLAFSPLTLTTLQISKAGSEIKHDRFLFPRFKILTRF